MKFISKVNNLRIVLQHGMPAEPLTGRSAVPGVYIKFENGVATVEDKEMCDKMLKHAGFNSDFIMAENDEEDPYRVGRKSSEPEHDIAELKYGQVQKNINPKKSTGLTEDQLKALDSVIKEEAKKLAMAMVPELLKGMTKSEDKAPEEPEETPEETEEPQEKPQEVKKEVKKTTTKKKK